MRRSDLSFGILVATLAASSTGACAQMHHVDAPERVTRAVGVYEWVGELEKPVAARLVPVTVFINGHMEAAGTYLARPVPLALETGNLYTLEFAGVPRGTIDIAMARNIAGQSMATDDNPAGSWYGYGHFVVPKPAKSSTLKPSVTLPDLAASHEDDRPHFVAPRPRQPEATASSGKPAAEIDDPEKPTLGKRDPDAQPEKEKKPKKKKPEGYVTGLPNGLNDDPDRPTLGRNKTGQVETPPLSGLPPEMKQAVAVSDAVNAETHEFAREWQSADEHASTLEDVEKLAKAAVKEYLTANALIPGVVGDLPKSNPTSAKAQPKSTRKAHARQLPSTQPLDVALTNEQLKSFELSYGGLPTFVYTAEIVATQMKPGSGPMQVQIFTAVVAQRLPSGELQVSLRSTTDDQHLSREPCMRFIDAVDADGSHRASLLFELRGRRSRQFALYRLTTAKADQTFATELLE